MSENNEYRALLAEAEGVVSDRTESAIHERIALRDAVCAYLVAERTRGVPLDVIRYAVQGILKRADARTGNGDGSDALRELARQLIDWCVAAAQPPQLKIVT